MKNFDELTFNKPSGESVSMQAFEGSTLLIVNTATKCGLTPQFNGLEKIHIDYKDKGLIVLGFPCNQFGNQEPETNESMEEICEINHGVTFQLTEKIDVNGPKEHEVFTWLKKNSSSLFGSKIKWNFTKFVVSADRKKVWRYGPTAAPEKVGKKIAEILKST